MNNLQGWMVAKQEHSDYLESILAFLLPEYERIFGAEVMNAAPCVIYNEPASECPMFCHTTPLKIRLSLESFQYWAQIIYQLSHEMCHFAIHQKKQDKTRTLSWFEEIVCEAMSMYALHYAAENWNACKLSLLNPNFAHAIKEYLDNILEKPGSDGFKQCTTIEKLRDYENQEKPENHRETHIRERNQIYAAILNNPKEAVCFLDYGRYVSDIDLVTIDFNTWVQNDPRGMVLQLFSVYPIGNEVSTETESITLQDYTKILWKNLTEVNL